MEEQRITVPEYEWESLKQEVKLNKEMIITLGTEQSILKRRLKKMEDHIIILRERSLNAKYEK